jgi:hypothetical protein
MRSDEFFRLPKTFSGILMGDSDLVAQPLLELFRTITDVDQENILFIGQLSRQETENESSFAVTDFVAYWLSWQNK